MLAYLLENNMLDESQRLLAFYILCEMYHHENVQTTPLMPVIIRTLQQYQERKECSRAEAKLLQEFLVSVPKVAKLTIEEFLKREEEAEELKIPDIRNYLKKHEQHMPGVVGFDKSALSAVIIDNEGRRGDGPDNEFPPEGIDPAEISAEELEGQKIRNHHNGIFSKQYCIHHNHTKGRMQQFDGEMSVTNNFMQQKQHRNERCNGDNTDQESCTKFSHGCQIKTGEITDNSNCLCIRC